MRRSLALALAAVSGLVLPAHAAPTGGLEDAASASVRLHSAHGVATLELLATTSSTGAQRLRVRLLDDPNRPSVNLLGDLPAGALTTAGGVTTLRTRLGGLPLRVEWRADTSTRGASLGHLDSDGSQTHAWVVAGMGAAARVTLGGARCTTGSAILGSVAFLDAVGYGAPLTRGLGVPARGLRCSAPEQTDLPPVP